MPKPTHVIRKLGSSRYNYFECAVCNEEGNKVDAAFSSGMRSEDGIGYDMKARCTKHQKEFEAINKIVEVS